MQCIFFTINFSDKKMKMIISYENYSTFFNTFSNLAFET